MRKFCLLLLGLLIFFSAQSQFAKREFTSPGTYTWTVPCGVTQITFSAWGGGGAGGGVNGDTRAGGGGEGGSFVRGTISVVPGEIYTIFVGAGGTGSSTNDGGNGSASYVSNSGGTTLFNAIGGVGGKKGNASAPFGAGGNSYNSGNVVSGTATSSFYGGNGGSASNRQYASSGGGGGSAGAGSNGGQGGVWNGGIAGQGFGAPSDQGADGANGRGSQDDGNGRKGGTPGAGGSGARNANDNNDYRGGHGGDGQVIITYAGYCNPTFNYNVEPITKVTFAGINNTTSQTVNGTPEVENFCTAGTVSIGTSYTISVQGNTDGPFYNYFTVWIDWNQNGTFENSERTYIQDYIYNSTGIDGQTVSAGITVSVDAALGTTKMRVVKNYNFRPSDACGNYSYGQAEDYLINVIGNCIQPTGATATDGTNTSSTSLSVCNGTKVTLRQTGGTKGTGTWEWRSGSCNGTIVGTTNAQDAELEITPPVGTTTYYVHSTCGAASCASVKVVVNTDGTISHTSGDQNLTVCKNSSITPVVYTIGGGANNASIIWSPSAPAGISALYNSVNKSFTISGTPSAAGTYNYTITPSGNTPCTNSSVSGSIVVSEGPATLNYTNNSITYCSGGPIIPNEPTVTGGEPNLYSVSPSLPAGLILDNTTGIISGTPTIPTALATYTVTATNDCGSTARNITIAVSTGDQAFNVTPSGIQTICSVGGSVAIGLSNSVTGISYQLFRDGSAIGPIVSGSTGNSISFGNYTASGVYTVKTTSSCATNMIGSVTLDVTPQPTTTFTYSNYTYCKNGTTPAAVMSGTPTTGGTFSASPAGLVFADASTGVIDLNGSTPGVYTITYNVAAAGGCSSYSYTQTNKINIVSTANFYSVTGGGEFCSGSGGVPVGLEGSQIGASYQLYRNGVAVTPAQVITGTGNPINFGNQTISGTYTVIATLGACAQEMDDEAVVSQNPVPENIKITPATTTLCQGSIIPLTASLSSETVVTSSVTFSSSNSVSIPNNNASGTFSVLKVAGIPAGATITGVSINFSITHGRVGDLVINLKGPNGNVLNIANQIGGTGNNFGNSSSNTFVNNTSTNFINIGNSPPFTSGPYAPQAAGAIAGATLVPGNISNTTTFSGLYGATAASANGNWIFSVRDKNGNGNSGTLNNCQIVITYTIVNNPVSVTWSPVLDLYSDPGGTVPYIAGNSSSTVYAKPSTSGAIAFTATATNIYGCSTNATATLAVNPSPALTIKADYCNYPGVVRIIAKSTIPINNWLWSDGTTGGMPNNSNDTSYINVNVAGTYFVSAKAAGNSCPATGVMSIAQELVTNGNFESGNTGFESDYYYQADLPGINNELVDHNANGGTNGYGIGTNGQNYHSNFWGIDHTYGTGNGNFMIVNGHGSLVAWKNENVTVLPNTTYYFSGWGLSLNSVSPFARLQFNIEGDGTYNDNNIAYLPSGVNNNSNSGWEKFYGKWTSGPSTTSVNISIVNLETSLGGNDFALDDISFGTLSTFFTMTSDPLTMNQSGICEGKPIQDITYEVGGDGNPPTIISGSLPPGVTTHWNGRNFRISGTPTTPGSYSFTLQSSGCNKKQQNVTIQVVPASDPGTFVDAPIISGCYGSDGTIILNGSVGTVQWQTSTDNINWSNTTNGNYTNLQSARYFRVIVQNTAKCDIVTSAPVKLGVKNLWTGKTNDSWNLNTNWSDESVPSTTCNDVVIPDVGLKPFPVIISGAPQVTNLIIKPNASLTIGNTGALRVAGTITNAGTLDAINGSIEFNGATTQTIFSSLFKDTTISKLIVSNGAGLIVSNTGRSLAITDKISFGSPNGNLNSGDNITLKSTKTKTASLDSLESGNSVSGKFTVERYLNVGSDNDQHGKGWQFLATPTQGQSIRDSWMEGKNTTTGFGTYIPNNTGSGWDPGVTYAPSIKSYNAATDTYVSLYGSNPLNATDPLYNEHGWMVFVRGDRNVVNSNQAVTKTTLRSKGFLRTGDVTFNVPAAVNPLGGFASFGNPYASAVDARKVEGLGDDGTYIVWNPGFTGIYGYGSFQTFTYDESYGGYNTVPGHDTVNNFILSGQAFFVQTFPGHTSLLKFHESSKGDALANKEFFREIGNMESARGAKGGKTGKLRTNIYTAAGAIQDGTLQFFDNKYSNGIDRADARKMKNSGVNLSIEVNGRLLVVERKRDITATDTISYNLTGLANGKYKFEFTANNLEAEGREGWLEDLFTQQRTPLSLEGETIVHFEVSNTAASKAANRFRIVFNETARGPLPVTFINVKALYEGGIVHVKWTVANENNLSKYVVMKSTDGSNFTDMADVVAAGLTQYNALDRNGINGYNYYRIRSVDKDGRESYSDIVKVWIGNAQPSITVFPNPIVNGVINLKLENMPKGKYVVRLMNPTGQVMLTSLFDHAGGNYTQQIPWDYKMAHGHYKLEVKQPDGGIRVITVMY